MAAIVQTKVHSMFKSCWPLVTVVLPFNKRKHEAIVDIAPVVHKHLVQQLFLLPKLSLVVCMAWFQNTPNHAPIGTSIVAKCPNCCGLGFLSSRANQARRAPAADRQDIDLLLPQLKACLNLAKCGLDSLQNLVGCAKDLQRCDPMPR